MAGGGDKIESGSESNKDTGWWKLQVFASIKGLSQLQSGSRLITLRAWVAKSNSIWHDEVREDEHEDSQATSESEKSNVMRLMLKRPGVSIWKKAPTFIRTVTLSSSDCTHSKLRGIAAGRMVHGSGLFINHKLTRWKERSLEQGRQPKTCTAHLI